MAIIIDTTDLQAEDLITNAAADGSDFSANNLLGGHPHKTRLLVNISGIAVSSLAVTLGLYRKDVEDGLYYKMDDLLLDQTITDTVNREYWAFEPVEVGSADIAVVVADAEEGATLKVIANREGIGA